jgi:hypothetical protein
MLESFLANNRPGDQMTQKVLTPDKVSGLQHHTQNVALISAAKNI